MGRDRHVCLRRYRSDRRRWHGPRRAGLVQHCAARGERSRLDRSRRHGPHGRPRRAWAGDRRSVRRRSGARRGSGLGENGSVASRSGGRGPPAVRLLADDHCRSRHFLRLCGQERPVPAAHLASRCHGRPYACLRIGSLRHDGRRRRLSGRQVLSRIRTGSAAADCGNGLYHAVHGGHDRNHGDRHWLTPRSANSAT